MPIMRTHYFIPLVVPSELRAPLDRWTRASAGCSNFNQFPSWPFFFSLSLPLQVAGKKEKGKEKKHKNKTGKKVKEKREEKEEREEKPEHVQFEETPQILPAEPPPQVRSQALRSFVPYTWKLKFSACLEN